MNLQRLNYETVFDFILLSDQPVDCPGNPSYYPDGAGDYPNGCPDNHEDFLEDNGKYLDHVVRWNFNFA